MLERRRRQLRTCRDDPRDGSGSFEGEGRLRRLCSGSEAVRELDHPNIVPLLEAGEAAGMPFLAMPFISGTNLSDVFRDLAEVRRDSAAPAVSYPVSVPDRRARPEHLTATDPRTHAKAVAMVGVQVARALGRAHGKGILHRDVKPGNLMLNADGRVFLTDFGLALAEGLPDLTRRGEVV